MKRQAYCVDVQVEARLGHVQAKVFEKTRWLIEQGNGENGKVFDGRLWVHFTYSQLERYVPGQSLESIKHAVRALKRDGLLVSQLDGRGQWLAINFERLSELVDAEAYAWYLAHSRSVKLGLVARPDEPEEAVENVASEAEASEEVRGAVVAHPEQGRGAVTATLKRSDRNPEAQRVQGCHIYRINTEEETQDKKHTTPKPPPRGSLPLAAGESPPVGGGGGKIIPFPVKKVNESELARAIGTFWRPDQVAFSGADRARLENVADYVRETHKKFPRMPDVTADLVGEAFTIWWLTHHPIGIRGERLARIEKLKEWTLWEAFCAWYLGRPNQDWLDDFKRQCPGWREQLQGNYAGFRAKYQSKLEDCWQGTGGAADYAALIHS